MTMQLSGPGNLREQAKRFELAARKLREAASLLEGAETEPTAGNGRTGKMDQLLGHLKGGPLTVKEIREKLGVSRGAVYAWLAKHRERVENKDGRVALKS